MGEQFRVFMSRKKAKRVKTKASLVKISASKRVRKKKREMGGNRWKRETIASHNRSKTEEERGKMGN